MASESLPLRITVDDREGRAGLARAIARQWEPVYVGRLAVGDVEIGPRVLIERKTVSDFVLSLERRRLFRQVAALSATAPRPLLVVEGEDVLDAGSLTPVALRGVLLTIMIHLRVPVLRTASTEETALFAAQIARQEAGRMVGKNARKRTARASARSAADVLGAIPGIGDARARSLLDAFGSPRGVFTASAGDLEEVPGIGPAVAASVKRLSGPEEDDCT